MDDKYPFDVVYSFVYMIAVQFQVKEKAQYNLFQMLIYAQNAVFLIWIQTVSIYF